MYLLVHAPDKDFARPLLLTDSIPSIMEYLNEEYDRVKEDYMIHLFRWDEQFNGFRQCYRFYWWRNNRFEDAKGEILGELPRNS